MTWSRGIGLDLDPLGAGVSDNVALGMAHASTRCATWPSCASTSTTTSVVDVHEESEEFEDSEPEDDFVAPVEDLISSSGDECDS
jgi:hypothetical protein